MFELKLEGNPSVLAKRCIKNMGKNSPYMDSNEYLNKLSQHCKLGVISNADNDFLYPVLEKIELKFDFILSSESAAAAFRSQNWNVFSIGDISSSIDVLFDLELRKLLSKTWKSKEGVMIIIVFMAVLKPF